MKRCCSCLKDYRSNGHFCPRCTRELFKGNRTIGPVLSFDKKQYISIGREISDSLSISGVQDKISLSIANNRLFPTKKGGTFILKPVPTIAVPLYQNDIPANEHLTMQLASQIFKIATALNTIVFFKCGEPAYLTKRFDVSNDGKIAQEDFCQLLNMTEETHGKSYKFDKSYEKASSVVKVFCSAARIEMEKFYFLVLFNYLFSNGDAHLKNFSLHRTHYKDYILTPAYDLISTSVHFPHEARTALDLFETYESESFRINAFYKKDDFLKLAELFEVKEKRAESFITRFYTEKPGVLDLINRSFLSDEAKKRYLLLFEDRLLAMKD